MTDKSFDELSATFRKASRQDDRTERLTLPEREKYYAILRKHEAQLNFENRAFEAEYDMRFEIARKRLINKAAAKGKDFTYRFFGWDKFDRAAIERQAERVIRHDHQRLIQHLRGQKDRAIDRLMQSSAHERTKREKPRADFAKAADRRHPPDRRKRNGPVR